MPDNIHKQLCDLINDHREANGLKRIPISMKLMLVAMEHVKDLSTYHPEKNCNNNFHSWSKHGAWKGGCYDPNDQSTHDIMWDKPKEIANYPSFGFEIALKSGSPIMDPNDVMEGSGGWKNSPDHNAVILNKPPWTSFKWKALGAAIKGNYACAWFGTDKDCFIATAAYGSVLADEVQFLRRYRESVVKRNRWGRACVAAFEKFYYSFSPRLAKLIEGRDRLRHLARIFVADPIVDMLLIGSFAFRSGRRGLPYSQDAHKKLLAGILVRGIGGWLYSISWIVWNAFLAYSFFRPEAILGAVTIWVPMMSGLVLTRIGAWMHKDIDFSSVAPI